LKIFLAQFKPTLSKSKNLKRHLEILSEMQDDIEVVVFPELSLNGYYLQDKVFEDFWTIEEFDEIKKESNRFDIVIGAVLKEERKFYNSALYFSGGELLHIHKKIELPNYGLFEEARFFSSGDLIAHFQTQFGKTALLVCEDLWSGKTIAKLEEMKPELIFIISNSPTRGFEEDGSLQIEEQWKSILSTTAILSQSKIVFVNRVGFEDGLGFWGGSMILNSHGQIETQLPFFDEVIN
jgi:omega-amidase